MEGELFHCSELDINPCCGCLGCKLGDQGCMIDDDMQRLYIELQDADALILGTPVYMGQMTGQAKVFIDRLSACFSPRFSPYFKDLGNQRKKLILVFDQGNSDVERFRAYFDYMRDLFQMLEFDVLDVLVVAGLRSDLVSERLDMHDSIQGIVGCLCEGSC